MEDQDLILDSLPPTPEDNERKNFLKGVSHVIIFYVSGLSLAALSYLIIGHPYVHAPGVHHLIVVLTFAGGFLWTIAAVVKYFKGPPSWKIKGVIFANILAILAFAFLIYKLMHPDAESITETREEITMSQNGDTTSLYHNDNIIYYKVGDSVLFNFIDSARFQKIVDSTGIKQVP